jgi:hypothetical protein
MNRLTICRQDCISEEMHSRRGETGLHLRADPPSRARSARRSSARGPCLHVRPDRRRRESQGRRLLSFRETVFASLQGERRQGKRAPRPPQARRAAGPVPESNRLGKGAGSPLFPASIGKTGKLSRRPLVRTDAADRLKRRLKQAGLPAHYSLVIAYILPLRLNGSFRPLS